LKLSFNFSKKRVEARDFFARFSSFQTETLICTSAVTAYFVYFFILPANTYSAQNGFRHGLTIYEAVKYFSLQEKNG
jgi:hypothetical protein